MRFLGAGPWYVPNSAFLRSLTNCLRITDTVDPPLDMYFDKQTRQLLRVDWREDIYRFSEWKDCDGTKYQSICIMFRRKSDAPWFFHEILELERLNELPEDLKR